MVVWEFYLDQLFKEYLVGQPPPSMNKQEPFPKKIGGNVNVVVLYKEMGDWSS